MYYVPSASLETPIFSLGFNYSKFSNSFNQFLDQGLLVRSSRYRTEMETST